MSTTLKLNAGEIADLRKTLNDRGFEFRRLDYAHFQARTEGLVISAYRSGKVVFAGAGEAAFLAEHGWEPDVKQGGGGGGDTIGLTERVVGSDESGKGDYFGPLTVAAVTAGPEDVKPLQDAGVRDCKKMSDSAILRAAAAIRKLCPHAIRTLTPVEYNAAHKEHGNVAIFMSQMHAEALAEAVDEDCTRVIIDKFTKAERLEGDLRAQGVDLPVEIRPRAEDNPAVAAASVLARAEFLIGLRELGNEFGRELPKGAGLPVEKAAREIYAEAGIEALHGIAKTHFKTTQKITERLF